MVRLIGDYCCEGCHRTYKLFSDDTRHSREELCRGCDQDGISATQAYEDKEYYSLMGVGYGPDSFDLDELVTA